MQIYARRPTSLPLLLLFLCRRLLLLLLSWLSRLLFPCAVLQSRQVIFVPAPSAPIHICVCISICTRGPCGALLSWPLLLRAILFNTSSARRRNGKGCRGQPSSQRAADREGKVISMNTLAIVRL